MKHFFTLLAILNLVIFMLITAPFVYLSMVLPKKIQQQLMYRYWKYFSLYVLHFVCLCKITKQSEITHKNHQTLYISNHRSLMDIPLFASNYQVVPLMKAEILKIPVLGRAAKMVGAITVSREDSNSRTKAFRQCLKALQSGQNMLFFPEGTRGQEEMPKDVSQINTPLLQYAYKLKIPVTPLAILGTENIIAKNGSLNFFTKVLISTKASIFPEKFSSDQEFIAHCWATVREEYLRCKTIL